MPASASEPVAPVHDDRPALRGFRLVSLLTLASRILGMLRDTLMAAAFGAGPVMDAFSVAFRLPNLARRLFGEGAQTSAFLPAFVRSQELEGHGAAAALARSMFWSLAAVLVALVAACEIGLAGLLQWGGLSGDARFLVELLMWLTPYVVFICLAAQQSAVLHGLRSFGWPAMAPIAFNLIWLTAIPVALAWSAAPGDRMRLLCAAILLGGAVQLLLPVIVLHRRGFTLGERDAGVGRRVAPIYRAMGPVLAGVAIAQLGTVFDSLLAWGLSPGEGASARVSGGWLPELPNGAAAALYFGQRMYQFPLGLIGVGLGTVLFPQFTRHAARGDLPSLNRDLLDGLKLTISVGVPAGVGLMLLAAPATWLLFEHGEFTREAGELTTRMIVAYGPGVPAWIGLLILQRGYYALGDRLTPLRHALLAMGVNLVLDVVLLIPLGAPGLAWATTLAAVVQCAASAWVLQRAVGRWSWNELGAVLAKTCLACAVMAAACQWAAPAGREGLSERALGVMLPLVAGGAAYLATSAAVGLREPWRLLTRGRLD